MRSTLVLSSHKFHASDEAALLADGGAQRIGQNRSGGGTLDATFDLARRAGFLVRQLVANRNDISRA